MAIGHLYTTDHNITSVASVVMAEGQYPFLHVLLLSWLHPLHGLVCQMDPNGASEVRSQGQRGALPCCKDWRVWSWSAGSGRRAARVPLTFLSSHLLTHGPHQSSEFFHAGWAVPSKFRENKLRLSQVHIVLKHQTKSTFFYEKTNIVSLWSHALVTPTSPVFTVHSHVFMVKSQWFMVQSPILNLRRWMAPFSRNFHLSTGYVGPCRPIFVVNQRNNSETKKCW